MEIHSESERAAFREWFAAVAEAQYAAPSPTWHAQDCSGLLRFAFVQALAPKTPEWFSQFAYLPTPTMPPVKTVTYPLPVLSRSAFRIAPGAYDPWDVAEGRIVGAATAGELMRSRASSSAKLCRVPLEVTCCFFCTPSPKAPAITAWFTWEMAWSSITRGQAPKRVAKCAYLAWTLWRNTLTLVGTRWRVTPTSGGFFAGRFWIDARAINSDVQTAFS